MTNTYRLILVSGAGAGTEYPLEKTELQLGRDLSNDIVINDPEVSRHHAHLILQDDGYIFEDLGSTNGTFIRGQRLAAPVVLRPGESITIGEKVNLKYEVISSDQSATVVVQRRVGEDAQYQFEQPQVPQSPGTPPFAIPPTPAVVPPPGGGHIQPPSAVYGKPKTKKKSKALTVILILLAILVVFCVIPLIIVDVTNSWCSIFGPILNMLFGAGTC